MTATDATGATGSQSHTLTVDAPLSFGGSGSLPTGIAGATYTQSVAATGGTGPLAYAVSAGALPPGVTLDPNTGALAGITTKPGTYTFTVTVTDALGRTASQTETVTFYTGSNLSPVYAVAAGNGGGARVEVYDRTTEAMVANFFAFESSFRGGAIVAVGDVNGDGVPDVAVSAGFGGGPRVVVIDGTKLDEVQADGQIDPSAVLANFFAFDDTLRNGVSVALARLGTGPGLDIVVGAGAGGGPEVRTFALTPGTPGGVTQLSGAIGAFFAFDPSSRFGVNVAAGNLDGTGTDDVIAGMGAGGAPDVAVFRADGTLRNTFTASNLAPLGGANVAAGYLDGTSVAQLVVATGPGGPPLVNVYTGTSNTPERTLSAFESSFTGGVSVNTGPVGNQSDIFLGAGAGGGPRIRVLTPNGVEVLADFYGYEPSFNGGVNVG
ncbi:putative Ig domain-containing protein [Fimbriiglobus ruber]|uniref:Alkaline phosphatase n=1 Tax=Fimbriiglobus ruber TaxID=1908690 RepID=A0A225E0W1_9BACT|nr:putative Ig domain-containing protein [Fimbriiglobus ruber]OWK47360.1 Alkaline phosphatase [Fimbriiglobus ruber]